MLQIKNDTGHTLQLPEDQKLTVEINSTIFDTDDVIKGSYSYPFRFGLNENNRKFIRNGQLMESLVEPDMKVRVTAGAHSFVATLTYKTSGLYADAALFIDMGALADQIRNVPLREFVTEKFVIGTEELPGRVTLLSLATAPPNTYPVVFPPFYNEDMVDKDWRPLDSSGNPVSSYKRPTTMNSFLPHIGTYINQANGEGDFMFVPMVYMCWLITYLCRKLGFSTAGSLFTDPELCRIVLFNTQSTPGQQGGNYEVEVGRHLGTLTISSFFKALRAHVGISIDLDTAAKVATFNVFRAIKQNKESLDFSFWFVPGTYGIDHAGTGGFVVNTFAEDIKDQEQALDGPVDFLSTLINSERGIASSYSIGNKSVEVSLAIGTLKMGIFPTLNPGNTPENPKAFTYLIPYCKEAGNLADPFFKEADNYCPYVNIHEPDTVPKPVNEWDFRILTYWGLRQDSQGSLFPYASSVSYDSKYQVFAGLSLQAGEPDDIWIRYQLPYYEFLAFAKQVTALFRIPLSDIRNITSSTQIAFSAENKVLERYLLEQLTYELPAPNGYALAKFEGRQIQSKLIKYNKPQASLYTAVWVEMRIENRPNFELEGQIGPRRGDIVLYTWLDGLFTIPEPLPSILFKYTIETYDLEMITYGNYSETRLQKEEFTTYIAQHRTVLVNQGLLWTQEFAIVDGFTQIVNTNKRVYIIKKGEGYRTRK